MRPLIFIELDEQVYFSALLGGDVAAIIRLNEYAEPRPVFGAFRAAGQSRYALLQNDDREPHRAARFANSPRRTDKLVQRDGLLNDVPLLLFGLCHSESLQPVDVELVGKIRQGARGYRVHQVRQELR